MSTRSPLPIVSRCSALMKPARLPSAVSSTRTAWVGIAAIRRAYRALYMGEAKLDEARAELEEIATAGSADVRAMLDFIDGGERPLLR